MRRRALVLAGFVGVSMLVGGALTSDVGQRTVVTSPLVGAERVRSDHEGRVVEHLAAGSYTYVRLAEVPGRWFVTTSSAPLGARVRVRGYAELADFRSRRLDRSFDRLVFASVDALEEP